VEGTPFGRYRLVELLGRGGMGEVWRAYDTAIDRVVALKVLPATFADDKVFQERFRREAKAAAGLDEPHVVPIHDFGEIDGRLYVTMRLINGRDLEHVLKSGPLPPARAVSIIEQIASALHAAHEIDLVHRDVKPSNILVAKDDFAYLIDFGIARAAGETGLTSTGTTIGTWAYMAPERFHRGTADARADVYALACVLYQSLTAELPFPGDSLEQLAAGHMFQPPPRPSAIRDLIPAAIDEVIAAGMAKDPDERYPSTRELALAARATLTVPPRAVTQKDWSLLTPGRAQLASSVTFDQMPTQLAEEAALASSPSPPIPTHRPGTVTVAALMAFLCAALLFCAVLVIGYFMRNFGQTGDAFGFGMGLVNVAAYGGLIAFLMWSGFAAWSGTHRFLIFAPLAVTLATVAVALSGGFAPIIQAIPLLISVPISVLLATPTSRQFFAVRRDESRLNEGCSNQTGSLTRYDSFADLLARAWSRHGTIIAACMTMAALLIIAIIAAAVG